MYIPSLHVLLMQCMYSCIVLTKSLHGISQCSGISLRVKIGMGLHSTLSGWLLWGRGNTTLQCGA